MSYTKEFVGQINRTIYFSTQSVHANVKKHKTPYLNHVDINSNTVLIINNKQIYDEIKNTTNLHQLQYITNVKLEDLGFNCVDLIVQENINNQYVSKILKNDGICITKQHMSNMKKIDSYDGWHYYKKITVDIKPIVLKRILTPTMPQLKYERTKKTVKNSTHWGQRKLLLTEIDFLTQYLNKQLVKNNIIVVYAGSAPGTHMEYLSELFPQIRFELYDPREFSKKISSKKINMHVQYFTDDTAKQWKSSDHDEDILLISDIRTGEPLTMTPEKVEECVKIDHEWQMNWYNIIKPKYTMFKFRLPWEDGYTKYLDGKIYIQPFPPSTSTETRLIIEENADMIMYDNRLYENQLFYHNNNTRKQKHINPLMDITSSQKNHLTNDFDSSLEIYIIQEYLKLKDIPDGDFKQCINMSKQINNISCGRTLKTEHNLSEKKISVLNKLKNAGYVPPNAKLSQKTFNTYVIPQYKKFMLMNYLD